MATAAERELYPLSTSDSKSIPLETIWPLRALRKSVAPDATTDLTIPAGMDLVSIRSTVDLLIDFANAATYPISDATVYPNALFVAAETIYTVRLPNTGAVNIVPLLPGVSGTLYIQEIQKWAALGLQRQLVNR